MRRVMLVVAVASLVAVAMSVSAPLAFAKLAPGKEACKNGDFAALGFSNQGQCVKAANQAAKAGEPFPKRGPHPHRQIATLTMKEGLAAISVAAYSIASGIR